MPAPSRSIVITFGRFNPPTTGHKLLFDHVVSTAHRLGADVTVYPSVSQDARSNPLPFSTKVKFLQRLFPRVSFNTNPQMRTPFDAFKDVASRGYDSLYVVVGADRAEAFQAFGSYFKQPTSRGFDPSKHIPLAYHVVSVPRRDIKTVSGTVQRQRAAQNDFAGFLRGSADPRRQDVIHDLFVAVRRGMNMHESRKLRLAAAQHSFQMPLVEQLNEGGATEGSGAPKPPSEVDRLKVRQNQEKIELQRRQGNELMAAKLRDVQQKAREQSQKSSAPKPASR